MLMAPTRSAEKVDEQWDGGEDDGAADDGQDMGDGAADRPLAGWDDGGQEGEGDGGEARARNAPDTRAPTAAIRSPRNRALRVAVPWIARWPRFPRRSRLQYWAGIPPRAG
ncbi:hypothetical protein SCWH03_57580 [Streptomyces pacificus]|uniref:Uncharacterized protein n=1 Tax=Streptomyces pacificus TaxID=2705029 RepID=A0A6A0B2F1_9ACTN|nr:hypothetical protein SCWH03_57580 [Streptomyces pacificus]